MLQLDKEAYTIVLAPGGLADASSWTVQAGKLELQSEAFSEVKEQKQEQQERVHPRSPSF